MTETENSDQEGIYPNNNIPIRQKEKHLHCRPEFQITKKYIKRGGGY